MSFISSKKRRQQQPQVVSSDMFFNFTPQAHPGVVSTCEELTIQQKVMKNMLTECSGLFTSNKAVKSEQNGREVYHTSGLYGQGKNSISLQELKQTMDQFNLACSVSFCSPSSNTTTLSMFDSSHITDENLKEGRVSLEAGDKGTMLVSFKKSGKEHYVESVDYHLNMCDEE